MIATYIFDRSPTHFGLRARARATPKRCYNGEFAPYCIRVATSACKPHNFKMEFNILASTKQASIAIAVMLALSMPSAPAFSASAPSNTAMQNQAAPAIQNGNLVRLRSGGPLMTVHRIEGDQVNCVWTDWDGTVASGTFPIDVLQVQ
jgi:uncharacterized protein YodC (DUF2158 family)